MGVILLTQISVYQSNSTEAYVIINNSRPKAMITNKCQLVSLKTQVASDGCFGLLRIAVPSSRQVRAWVAPCNKDTEGVVKTRVGTRQNGDKWMCGLFCQHQRVYLARLPRHPLNAKGNLIHLWVSNPNANAEHATRQGWVKMWSRDICTSVS